MNADKAKWFSNLAIRAKQTGAPADGARSPWVLFRGFAVILTEDRRKQVPMAGLPCLELPHGHHELTGAGHSFVYHPAAIKRQFANY
jgi:hypothetical protein